MRGSDVIGISRLALAGLMLLLLAAAGFYWLEREDGGNGEAPDSAAIVVMKEAEAEGRHYVGYVWNGAYYVEDLQAKQPVRLRAFQGEAQQAMSRQEARPAASFSRYEDSGLIDPTSLGIGIVPSIPYTFDCPPERSFVYLETLLSDGWAIAGYYGDSQYIDYYIRKENTVVRLIILKDRMKLFYNVDWKIADPRGYVSR